MDFDINKEKLTILKDGKEVECDILFTFDSEDTNKSYIGYTDNTMGSNGRKNIYVSSYDPVAGPSNELQKITDERELEMVKRLLTDIDQGNI